MKTMKTMKTIKTMKNTPIIVIMTLGFFLTTISFCISENKTHVKEWVKFNDLRTGNEVWKITGHDSISESFYFRVNSVTSDDKYVIFRSKRSGRFDIYRCNLTNGEIAQLTNEGISFACIQPDGENMVFISDWRCYKMNVHTLKKEMVLDFTGKLPSNPFFGSPTFTNDGKYTLVFTSQDSKNISSGQNPSGINLYRVNLETKEILKVLERGNFSHALINPVDPNLITYVPGPDTQNNTSLPMQDRARTRIIRVDKGTNEPYLMTPYGFRATHDSWSPLGNRFFFFEKTVGRWTPVSICSIDLNGSDYTRYYTQDSIKLGHGAVSTDGKWFIADGQDSNNNPLILLNLQDGKAKILCWPDASINTPAEVHVHPNFSSSGNFIIYTSDIIETDKPQVYVIPIKHIKDAW